MNPSASEPEQGQKHKRPADESTDDSLSRKRACTQRAQLRPTCFRITGVPSDWDENELKEKLLVVDPNLNFLDVELSIFPACSHYAKTKAALLLLRESTPYFKGWEPDKEAHSDFRENGRKVRLCIDRHFRGLTPLNNPQPDTPIRADIIAITGFAGHAFGSWQSRANYAMWLYDFLPEYFQNTRIMTYGYNCSLLVPNGLRLTDYRKHFVQELQNARVGCRNRPIIFIAHSLGGILVTQAMLESFRSPKAPDRDLFISTRGVIFFGTPHQGLNVDDLKIIVEMHVEKGVDIYDLPQLLGQLRIDSELLDNHEEECRIMWAKFGGRIYTFYETEKTNTVIKATDTIQRNGPPVQKVFRCSAQLRIEQEKSFPIDSNHTDMVKFAMEGRDFNTVVRHINECLCLPEQSDKEHILQSLIHSVETMDNYCIDQKNYVETSFEARDLEENDRYFWIFRNMDYEKWINLKENACVLILRGSRILEEAACHITRTLQNSSGQASNLLIFFFYGSAANSYHLRRPGQPDWQNVVALCSVLRQVLDSHQMPQRQLLLESFWKEILTSITDEGLKKLPIDPIKCGVHLLSQLSTQHLWDALGSALRRAGGLKTLRGTQDLTIVFDLDSLTLESTIILIDSIRRVTPVLLKSYRTVRVLITTPPVIGDLKLKSSETLLEYDRERQGHASQPKQGSLLTLQ